MASLAPACKSGPAAVAAVQAFVDRAAAQPPFMKALTASLVKAEKALAKAKPEQCSVMLGWVGALLRAVPLPGAAKAAEALVRLQLRLLELAAGDPAAAPAALGAAAGPALARRALVPSYAAVDPAAAGPAAGAVLCAVAAAGEGDEDPSSPSSDASVAAAALELYLKGVLGAKVRPATGLVSCFDSLVAAASEDEVAGKIMPVASRVIKRSPEVVMGALARLMGALGSKPGLAAGLMAEVRAGVLAALRHSDAVRQGDAGEMLAAFAAITPAQGDLSPVLAGVWEALVGRVAKSPGEKEGHLRALRGVAGALAGRADRGAFAEAATAAFSGLCAFAREEPNEAVKASGITTAALFAPLLGDELPGEYLALLAQVEAELGKEPLRRAHLVSACDVAWARPDLRAQMAPALPALEKCVAEGVAKAPLRYDAMSALLAAVLVARTSEASEAALRAAPFWGPALTEGSKVLDPAAVHRLGDDQLRSCSRLCRTLLEEPPRPGVPDPAWLVPVACDTLAACLVRESAVSGAAAACCQAVIHDGVHTDEVFDALLRLVGAAEADVPGILGVSGDDAGPAVTAAIQRALSGALPEASCSLTPRALATAMVCAMHPAATGGAGASPDAGPWLAMSERGGGLDGTVGSHAGHGLVATLRGHLRSEDPDLHVAAARSLAACVASAPESTWHLVLDALAELLDRGDHDALTAMDRVVFFTPEGELATETDDGRALVLADDVAMTIEPEDAAAAEEVRLPLKKGEKPNPQAESRLRQLAREAGSRKRTQRIKGRLDLGLRAVGEICDAAAPVVEDNLGALCDLVSPLLGSVLVGPTSARAATEALCRCLPAPLCDASAEIGEAMQAAVTQAPQRYVENEVVRRVVLELQRSSAAIQRPLPPPAYALVFPVLEAVLTSGLRTKVHDPAISVVALHAAPSMELPRARLFASLYAHLEGTPAAKYQLTPLLQTLGAGVTTADEVASVLAGALCGEPHVRVAALSALARVPMVGEGLVPPRSDLVAGMHVACFDETAANAAIASKLFAGSGLSVAGSAEPRGLIGDLTGPAMLSSRYRDIRVAAGKALAAAAEALGADALETALETMIMGYVPGATDAVRSGVAVGLAACARLMSTPQVEAAVQFLLSRGMADPADDVRADMVAAAQEIADAHGESMADALVPTLESFLDKSPQDMDEETYDFIREGAVIMLGTVAAHIPASDPKVREVAEVMIQGLRTPSEAVQRSCGQCLAPLTRRLAGDAAYVEALVQRLSEDALSNESYAERRGAAFGLAGVVKGLGLASLKKHGIIDKLSERCESRKDTLGKEGALYSFAAMTEALGRLFEPYVIRVLPVLLTCFGDGARGVQEAAGVSSRAIMGQLTGWGIRLVLPHILQSLEESAWRTKQGAVQLLAAMAFCAPKQLGSALPQIVPKLGEVLSDPHEKVKDAAKEALRQVGETIQNPEVRSLAPTLLDAISNTSAEPKKALDAVLGTTFINTVDSASLALLVPIIERGMKSQVSRQQLAAAPHPSAPAAPPCAPAGLADDRQPSCLSRGPTSRPRRQMRAANSLYSLRPAQRRPASLSRGPRPPPPRLPDAPPPPHPPGALQTGEVKRKACRILGSLCNLLTDPTTMVPYLDSVLRLLKACMVDAGPEVRATAAKALGSLVEGLGEERFEGLLPWLHERVASEVSTVERQGASQGLAHVLAVLGPARLADAMPGYCEATRAARQHVREGHITLLRYLPMAMGHSFEPHLSDTLSCILAGLADETEGVRDASLKAGKTLVDMFASTSMALLLPSMEEAMFSGDYRIRQAAIDLLGSLLFSALGLENRLDATELADDENAAPVNVHAQGEALRAKLGNERYQNVLSRLFIARSDVALAVRSAALNVWKSLVDNTPRAMNEILPVMLDLAVTSLSHAAAERREMCGRAIGELVRKLGDKVIIKAVPILKAGAMAPDASKRRGACLGFKETLESMTRHQLAEHLTEVLPSIQDALTDDDEGVREAAGDALSSIFRGGGAGVVDSVVPSMMRGLEGSEAQQKKSLEGLSVILSVRPGAFNAMLPKLVEDPPSVCRVDALAALAPLAGASLDHHLPKALPLLFAHASSGADEALAASCQSCANALVAMRLDDEPAVAALVRLLSLQLESEDGALACARAVGHLAKSFRGELREHAEELLPPVVLLLASDDENLAVAGHQALGALTGAIPKEAYPSLVRAVKDAVSDAAKGRPLLPGLCIPKGIAPLVPVYVHGLLQGSSTELREAAADGLGDLVRATTAEALKPFVLQITGPLIRILGDRFPAEIKAAILRTLGLIIGRAGVALKPFVPQLQTSFLKCLNDPDRTVRDVAATNLGDMSPMSVRLDQLASDLASTAASHDPATCEGFLRALRGVVVQSGEKLKEETFQGVCSTLSAMAGAYQDRPHDGVEGLRAGLAGCLGAIVGAAPAGVAQEVLSEFGAGQTDCALERVHFQALVLAAAGRFSAARALELAGAGTLAAAAVRLARASSFEAREALGAVVAGLGAADAASGSDAFLVAVLPVFSTLLGPDMYATVQVNALRALRRIEEARPGALRPHLGAAVPAVCMSVEKLSGLQKIYAERTLGVVLGVLRGADGVEDFLASPDATASMKKMLTETYVQRLMRLCEKVDDDDVFDDVGL